MNIDNLKTKIAALSSDVSSLKGKVSFLEEQYQKLIDKLEELKTLSTTNEKAIELLNFVQRITRDLIKDTFENITTKALQYIHQSDDYKFELDFGRRGSIPELKFNVKTPEMEQAHDILTTRGGGSSDIISLALRLVLLEVSKQDGFLFLDEPEKHLDSQETLEKMISFVKEIQKDTKRQIFWITHKEDVVNSVANPIIIQNTKPNKETIKQSVKKRGRPKKNV